MSQPDSYDGYDALFERPEDFRNEICGRVALTIGGYRPGRRAAAVSCPLLVLTCAADTVTPPAPARRMAEGAPLGRSIEYPPEVGGHFAIYVGELFERTIADQIVFLREAFGAGPAPQASPDAPLAATSAGD
jgi:pimeloyl-ACP methyl ester carboxylesterase